MGTRRAGGRDRRGGARRRDRLVVVFGPTYTECQAVQLTPSGPVPPEPTVCVTRSLWELHGRKGFPAPYGFLLAWSLAPILAVVGVIARLRRRASFGVALVGLALAIDASSAISFGAGPYYVPVLVPALVITLLALLRS